MANELIVHIGHGKTGSSYIQSILALNAPLLKKHGFNYPNHKSFINAKKGNMTSGNGDLLLNGTLRVQGKTVISSEGLFFPLRDETIEDKLLSYNCDVTVILYTRNVFELYASSWGQVVKTSAKSENLNEFLCGYNDDIFKKMFWWIKVSDRLGFKLKIFNYSHHKQDIFAHFAKQVFEDKAQAILAEIQHPPHKKVNRSLTEAEYQFQLALNKHMQQPSPFISEALVNTLPDIKTELPYIARESYDEVVQRVTPIIRHINKNGNVHPWIEIEPYEELLSLCNDKNHGTYSFTQEQIDVLAATLAAKLSQSNGRTETLAKLKQLSFKDLIFLAKNTAIQTIHRFFRSS